MLGTLASLGLSLEDSMGTCTFPGTLLLDVCDYATQMRGFHVRRMHGIHHRLYESCSSSCHWSATHPAVLGVHGEDEDQPTNLFRQATVARCFATPHGRRI